MELLIVGTILLAALFVALAIAGLFVLKAVWWVVTLPFRILFALLWVPFTIVSAVLAPLGAVLVVVALGVAAAVVLPILIVPLVLIALLVWLVVAVLTPATA